MTTPISFSPYLGWVDTTDPANIPANVRIIGAADLLRYEIFGQDATARINDLITGDAANPTIFAPIAGSTAYAAKSVETSKENAITAGTTAQYWRGDKTWQTLDKTAAGLGSVDNIADTAKPVSVLQAAADALLAKGCVYSFSVATNTGNFSALTVVYNIASFTFKAGRKYRIVWDTDWLSASTDTAAAFTVASASTADAAALTTGLTVLGVRNAQSRLAVISAPALVTAYYDPAVDTTTQIKFLASIDGAGTTLTVQGNRTGGPTTYRIYDDGAQP